MNLSSLRLLKQDLLDLLTQGVTTKIVKNGLPENSRFVNLAYDFRTDDFILTVEHESFPSKPIGAYIPIHEGIIVKQTRRRYKK